jgi:hypothetical protein
LQREFVLPGHPLGLLSSWGMSGEGEKIGTRRIILLTGGPEEARRLKSLQDGKCVEGGCDQAPIYKLEEKMAHEWVITDFLCAQHADEWSSRYGLGRLQP